MNDYFIGQREKKEERDVEFESVTKDGKLCVVTIKEKNLKQYHFGVMGYFDKYILQQFKDVSQNLANVVLIISTRHLQDFEKHL